MTHDASDGLTIRVMTRDDLDLAIAWAAAEGWNPGLADAGCFQAADPAGFLMGFSATSPSPPSPWSAMPELRLPRPLHRQA